jgi:hypothetical protein
MKFATFLISEELWDETHKSDVVRTDTVDGALDLVF